MGVDWEYWNQMPSAKVWECVCLSLDVDPRTASERGLQQSMGSIAKVKEYDDRLCIAEKHVVRKIGKPGLYTQDAYRTFEYWEINIPQFVAWATHLNREIPEQFTGYSPPAQVDIPSLVAIKPDPPLSVKERENLQRVIGVLLAVIKGENGHNKHRDYTSEAELIRTIEDKYSDKSGLKQRNLESVFKVSKQSLKS